MESLPFVLTILRLYRGTKELFTLILQTLHQKEDFVILTIKFNARLQMVIVLVSITIGKILWNNGSHRKHYALVLRISIQTVLLNIHAKLQQIRNCTQQKILNMVLFAFACHSAYHAMISNRKNVTASVNVL